MPTTVCEACGRPILPPRQAGSLRFGLLFTPFKAQLIDIVAAAPGGITTPEIIDALYRERPRPRSRTIKVHVFMLNTVLPRAGHRIVNERRRWFLRKVEP